MKTHAKPTAIGRSSSMWRTISMLKAMSLAAGLCLLLPGVSYAAPLDCTVNFSDRYALSRLVEKAAWTFAYKSTKAADGKIVHAQPEPSPSSAQTDLRRWQYRQGCNASEISVWDQTYSHFHLMFRDPRLSCFVPNGFGRMIDGQCVPPQDYANEPRVAASHDAENWWEILLMNSKGYVGTLRSFDLKTIEVGGTTPIQMWFRKTDGSVWGYSSLPAGFNWDVSGAAAGIVAVWISGAPGQVTSFQINSFSIRTY